MVILAYKTFILLLVSFSFFFPLFCSASLLPHKNRPRSIWQMFRSRWQYWIAWPKIPFFHIFSLHICIFSKLSTLFFVLFGFFQLFRFFCCFQAYVPCGRWRATGNRLYMPFSIFSHPTHTFTHFF